MRKVSALIVGAGNRGFAYSEFAGIHPERLEIKAVAEPRQEYRDIFVKKHGIKAEMVFESWQEAVQKDRLADFVIIATQDRGHLEPAVAFAEKGYNILLEKPMSVSEEECRKIFQAVDGKNLIFGVCHVLRYTPFTIKLKEIIDSGAIGEIVSLQRIEPVGFWHYAHSYVRGNWNNEKKASFMLLAKSCHDIDWIYYIMQRKCVSVSSFGSLKYFRHENRPSGAAERCTECKIEKECPYSAVKIYMEKLNSGNFSWPLNVITTDFTENGVMTALRNGPYGRCVYACDNDVVDNQVVNMLFEDGATASFAMVGPSEMHLDGGGRRTTIFGTSGEIRGNDNSIEVYDYLTGKTASYRTSYEGNDAAGGHGGGDYGIMDYFVRAVAEDDPSIVLSGPGESLESHLIVFAAEKSRVENRVVNAPF